MGPMSTRSARAADPRGGAAEVPGAVVAVEVDASMRLLREVMAHPLDPGYAMAAERRRAGGPGRSRTGAAVTVVLALLCGWIFTRGVGELRRPEPGQAAGRAALEREITRRTRQADARQQAVERLRAEIAAAQQAQLTSPEDTALTRRVQQLALAAGEIPVTGPGLKITLTDAPSGDHAAVVDPRAPAASEDGRVLDRDVQIVVNGLWAAGAESIAINGRRLTSLSAIRSAGQAILVDFRPLVPPYVVSAVGDPTTLQDRFVAGVAGGYVQRIRDSYGVGVDIARAARLDLPGAGTLALRTAAPVPPASGSPTTSSPSTSSPAPSTEVSP
jgi:uncharacterized protein YlxW (UPF0749 family)